MKTLREVLTYCTNFLQKKEVQSPKLQAELVIAAALEQKRLDLYMDLDRPLTIDESAKIKEWILERGRRKPLGYIEKKTSFYGVDLDLNEDVLIPRQETEILVDKVCKVLEKQDLVNQTFADICTGSGAIAIALKKRFPTLRVLATDLSEKALQIAKNNALKNKVDIEFYQGDLLEPVLDQKIDYIVCNPPYISDQEWTLLEPEVKDFEPKMALIGGTDGLDLYRRFHTQFSSNLSPKTLVWFEIGHSQTEGLEKIFQSENFHSKKIYQDYSDKDRFFFLERRVKNSYSNG